MKDSTEIEGKIYISSTRGADISGYSKDYIGQLCRAKKIDSRIVGRTWYVAEDSLLKYKKEAEVAEQARYKEYGQRGNLKNEEPKEKKYISSNIASDISGYSKDYIGQLSRGKKIDAKLVGRVWYVEESSLLAYKQISDAAQEARYKDQGQNVPPVLKSGVRARTTPPEALVWKYGEVETAKAAAEIAPITASKNFVYEKDERPLLPTLVKKALEEKLQAIVEVKAPIKSPFSSNMRSLATTAMILIMIAAGSTLIMHPSILDKSAALSQTAALPDAFYSIGGFFSRAANAVVASIQGILTAPAASTEQPAANPTFAYTYEALPFFTGPVIVTRTATSTSSFAVAAPITKPSATSPAPLITPDTRVSAALLASLSKQLTIADVDARISEALKGFVPWTPTYSFISDQSNSDVLASGQAIGRALAGLVNNSGNSGSGFTGSSLSASGNGTFGGNLTVGGDLTVSGNTNLHVGSNGLLATDPAGIVVSTSTPTVAAITATSTTVTSTFAGPIALSGAFLLRNLPNCNSMASALQTDSAGNVSCGTIVSFGGSSAGGWDSIGPNLVRLATTTDIVGIGTTSPGAKLAVNSGSVSTTTLALAAVAGQSADILQIYDNTLALNSVFKASGFLGLGTTSPSQALSVQGNALFSGNINAANVVATNVTAANFYSTSNSASVFPYASSTAITISGANGLTLATLTGPLEAISGAVSASSTLSTFYGGTGLNSVGASSTVLVSNGTANRYLTLSPANFTTTNISQWNNDAGYLTLATQPFAYPFPLAATSTTLTLSGGATLGASTTINAALRLPSLAQGILFTGTGGLVSPVGTTSASCSGSTSCTPFTVMGSSPITISSTDSTASSTLLSDNNTWTGTNRFNGSVSFGSTGTSTFNGDILVRGISAWQYLNVPFIQATSTTASQLPYASTTAITSSGSAYLATAGGAVGIGSTTPGSLLSVGNTNGINFSTATSTFSSTGGINLAAGCFAVNGICVGGSTGGGTVSSGVAGQLAFYAANGTTIVGSSTDSLTIGRYIATSTTASSFLYASTTALTVSGIGGLSIGSLTGPLQAVNGAVSASSTLSTFYGGTGLSIVGASSTVLVSNGTTNRYLTLSPSNFTSQNISQWNNDSGYLSSVTGIANSIAYFNAAGNLVSTSSTLYSGSYVATTTTASQFPYASTTMITATTASTTNLIASGLGGTSVRCLQVGTDGTISANASACGSGGGTGVSSWATTTSSVPGNLINYSVNSTDIVAIGNTSTTTAKYWFDPNVSVAYLAGSVGIGSTTPGSMLSIGNTNGINFSTATSTFSSTGGINLASGCFAINGTCMTANTGTVTSIATNNGLTGGTITTSGTIGLDVSQLVSGSLTYWNGSRLAATGTPSLTSGYFISTTTTASQFPYASTTAITSSGSAYLATAGGNVGIGTTTPTAVLHLQENSGTGGAALKISNRNSTRLWGLGVDVMAVDDGEFSIADDTAGITRMVINTNGNIGIGTTSPTQLLSVHGSGLFSGNVSLANLTATGTASVGTLSVGSLVGPLQAVNGAVSASSTLSTFYGGTGLSIVGASSTVLVSNGTTNRYLTLSPSNFTSQNISQWTNNAGYLTSLAGAASSTLLSDNNTWTGNNVFTSLLASGSSTIQNFTFVNATGTAATTTSSYATTASSTNLYAANLSVGANGLFVNQNGNVGIGTSSPYVGLAYANNTPTNTDDKLVLQGGYLSGHGNQDYGFSTVYRLQHSNGVQNWAAARVKAVESAGFGGQLIFETAFPSGVPTSSTTEALRITSGQLIGLGTTTPSQVLSVQGNGLFSGNILGANLTATGTLAVNGTASSTFAGGIDAARICITGTTQCLNNQTNGTVTSIATNNGLTGGTITTSGTIGLDVSQLVTGSLAFWNGSRLAATGTPSLTSGHFISTTTTASQFPYASTTAITSSGSAYFATAGGNVGIGTTTPLTILDVLKSGATSGVSTDVFTIAALQTSVANANGTGLLFKTTRNDGTLTRTSNAARIYTNLTDGTNNAESDDLTLQTMRSGTLTDALTVKGSGNVGIGTTTPGFKLQVASDITYPGDVSNGGSQLSVSGVTTPTKRLDIGYDTSSGNGFGFLAAGNQGTAWTNLVLQPTGGNVGIGTTTPGWAGSSKHFGIGFGAAGGTLASTIGASSGNGDSSLTLYSGINAADSPSIVYQTNTSLRFGTTNSYNGSAGYSEKMRITSDGSLGIGISTPSSKLDIQDSNATTTLSSTITGTTKDLPYSSLAFRSYEGSSAGAYGFNDALIQTVRDNLAFGTDTFTHDAGLAFYTNTSNRDGAPTEKLRITSVGNIGIGTTSPSQRLSIQGSALVSGDLSVANIVATGTISTSGNMTVSNDAYTTYGPNTTWGSFLRVGGNGRTVPTSDSYASVVTTNGNIHIDPGTTRATYLNYYSGTAGVIFGTGTGAASGASVSAAGLITGNGLVSVAAEGLRIIDNNSYISLYNGAGTIRSGYLQANAAGAGLYVDAEASSFFGVKISGSEKFRVAANGNVGIGTTTPDQKLTVYGSLDVGNGGQVLVPDGSNSLPSYTFTSASDTGLLYDSGFGAMGVSVSGTRQLNFANGAVYSPNSSSGAYINTSSTVNAGGPAYSFFGDTSSGMFSPASSALGFSTNSVERMRITNGGNIGIGTTSPFATLSVNSVAGQAAFAIGSSSATSFIVDKFGNVGVGIATPTSIFQVLGSTAAAVSSGNGGAAKAVLTVLGGAGGDTSAGSGAVAAGKGSNINITSGPGGSITGTPAVGTGGTGGDLSLTAGAAGTGTTFGGLGGNVNIAGGTGGNGTSQGAPGYAAIKGGNAFGIGNMNGGDVFIVGGQSSGTGVSGNVYLGVTAGSVLRGGVSIGSASAPLSKLDVNGGVAIGSYASTFAAPANSLIVSGNVGVGTSSPWAELSVNADGLTGPSFFVGSSTATNLIVTNGGLVGIGSSTPTATLTVKGASGPGFISQDAPLALSVIGGAGGAGSTGGGVLLQGGTGGSNSTNGGNGGGLSFLGGKGQDSFSGVGGVGGNLTLTAGSGGTFSIGGTDGNGGNITLNPGAAGGGTASDGNVILSNLRGKVGIGTTSPSSTLTVTGSGCFSKGVGATAACGTTAGDIYYNTAHTNAYDVAENYKTSDLAIAPGDIVKLDPNASLSVVKASKGDQIFGVVSTDPGLVLGGSDASMINAVSTRPIALSGRVPVKVDSEGGAIAVGDPITVSTVAGVGKKARGTEEQLGVALTAWSGGPTDMGTIQIFVSSKQRVAPSQFTIDTNGNVGIGNATPTHKLDVVGDVSASAFIVNNNGENVDIYQLSSSTLANVNSQQRQISDLKAIQDAQAATILTVSSTTQAISSSPVTIFDLVGLSKTQGDRIVAIEDSLTALTYRVDVMASTTADLQTTVNALKAQIAAMSSAPSSQNATPADSAAVASELASSTPFIQAITNSVKVAMQTVGEWTMSKLTAQIVIVDRIEAKTVAISQGMDIIDQATGSTWCVTIKNGEWSKVPWSCLTPASATAAAENSVQPIITPITQSSTANVVPITQTAPVQNAYTATSTASTTAETVTATTTVQVTPEPTVATSTEPIVTPVITIEPTAATSTEAATTTP